MSSPMELMQGPPMGGTYQKQDEEVPLTGGRRRRRGSRSRKGRKGRGGYLMDVAVAAGLLGATQLSKRRYGYNGPTRRRSRRSRRSSRSRSRR
jgi:hypothetical protein